MEENSDYVLTSKERVERMAAGGVFCLLGYGGAAVLAARHAEPWTAAFLFLPFLAGISCIIQARSYLCAFKGLREKTCRSKALLIWLFSLMTAVLCTGAVFFILLKQPFTNPAA